MKSKQATARVRATLCFKWICYYDNKNMNKNKIVRINELLYLGHVYLSNTYAHL